jgi:hypothetical protein
VLDVAEVAGAVQAVQAGGGEFGEALSPGCGGLRDSCRVSCALPGRSRHAGVKDPFQGTPATSDGERLCAFCYAREGRRGRCPSRVTSACPRQMYPEQQILRRASDNTRLVVCEPIGDLPAAWNEVPKASYGVIGKRHDQVPSFTPSPRRKPGDRVRAGRLHPTADRPPDVGTSDPDPRFAVG